jgi:ribonuclease P protein component
VQRHLRLRRAEDFSRLRRVGTSHPHRFLVLSCTPNELTHNRYGFIVSKHLGKAVTRNRIRRRLREIVRALDPQLTPGFDVVLIARQPLAQQPFDVITRTVNELFRRAELFRGDVS